MTALTGRAFEPPSSADVMPLTRASGNPLALRSIEPIDGVVGKDWSEWQDDLCEALAIERPHEFSSRISYCVRLLCTRPKMLLSTGQTAGSVSPLQRGPKDRVARHRRRQFMAALGSAAVLGPRGAGNKAVKFGASA